MLGCGSLLKTTRQYLTFSRLAEANSARPTEIVFVERCLQLLRSGGRMGIVLRDGNLNNPSRSWLRRWCEGKAHLLSVISLPQETLPICGCHRKGVHRANEAFHGRR